MRYKYIDRLFLEKPRFYNMAILIVSIVFMVAAIFLLFNYEKRSLSLESERYVRRTVVEVNKYLMRLKGGLMKYSNSAQHISARHQSII